MPLTWCPLHLSLSLFLWSETHGHVFHKSTGIPHDLMAHMHVTCGIFIFWAATNSHCTLAGQAWLGRNFHDVNNGRAPAIEREREQCFLLTKGPAFHVMAIIGFLTGQGLGFRVHIIGFWRAGCKGWLWLAVIWHVTGAKRNPEREDCECYEFIEVCSEEVLQVIPFLR